MSPLSLSFPSLEIPSMWPTRPRLALVAAALTLPSLLGAALPPSPKEVKTAQAKPTSGARLPAVQMDGTYFTRNGKRFIPVGAHWVPAKAAMHWPVDWNPKEIEADFAKMHDLGYNLVRFDVMWAWVEPRPGDYNPVAFEQLDYLFSLAHKYQIYLHPSILCGGEVGEAFWDVPWRRGRNPHTDPDMLRLETNHAMELGRRYANETALIAWDLTDEPPIWFLGDTRVTDAMAVNWTRLIAGGIRKYDKVHPIVVGTSGEETNHGPFRSDLLKDEVEFFSVHPFTIYMTDLFPDPMLSERGTYGAAFEIALSAGGGRPSMIHEMGASSAMYSPERIAKYDLANMYSGFGAGSIGVDLWCYTDAAPAQWKKFPYARTAQETQWGMTTWDRQDRPLATEFRKFAKIMAQLDLTGVKPTTAEIGVVIPDEWAKPNGDFSRSGLTGPEILPYLSSWDGDAMPGESQARGASENGWLQRAALTSFILGRRAGLKVDFPREFGDWEKRPMVFLPSPLTSTSGSIFLCHVRSDFYGRAKKYVEEGGFLYASVAADAAIPDMESLFGARLVDAAVVTDLTLKIVAPFGNLKPGDTFHFDAGSGGTRAWGQLLEVKGGQVIAVDQEGRPALVAHTLGKGKTLVSAYPLENYLSTIPAVFEKPEQTHALYQAFRDWAGVEVTALNAERSGYAVLVNHSAKTQTVTITTTLPVHALSQITAEGPKALNLKGATWQMELEAYAGAVVQWK